MSVFIGLLGPAGETSYSEQRRLWGEDRGISWTPKNRRPEKLRDVLKECEVRSCQSFFLLILSRHNWIVSKGEINNCYIFGMFFKENILIYCEIKKAMWLSNWGQILASFFFFFQEQNLIFSTFMQLYCYIVLKSIGSSSSNAVERLFRNKSC